MTMATDYNNRLITPDLEKGREMKDVAVSQCTFPTNGHAVVSN